MVWHGEKGKAEGDRESGVRVRPPEPNIPDGARHDGSQSWTGTGTQQWPPCVPPTHLKYVGGIPPPFRAGKNEAEPNGHNGTMEDAVEMHLCHMELLHG